MKRAVPVRKVGGANKRAKSGAGDGKSHFNFSDDDEVIDSDGSGISGNEDGSDFFEDVENSDDEKETVQEKRIRLAKSMLDKIAVEEGQGGSGEEDAVADRLHNEALRAAGRLTRNIATLMEEALAQNKLSGTFHRGHNGPLTAVAFGKDDDTCWTASKDCSIIRWHIGNRKRMKKYPGRKANRKERRQKGGAAASIPEGHYDEILALAASDDGRFLVSGGRDKALRIWNAKTDALLDTFRGHRDIVSCMCFQKKTRTLFTGSYDRCIKIWNLDEMGYVDTLFGHQSFVQSLDCLRREQPLSSGDDRSVRLWKVESDSQLIFRGHKRSIDAAVMVDNQNYVSCSQDGTVALWNMNKKRPIAKVENAHPRPTEGEMGEGSNGGVQHCWVSAIAAFPASDLVATGSSDGFIRFWHANLGGRALTEIAKVEAKGFVNALAFSPTGKYLVAGIGQEPRLGRWERNKDSKNGIFVVDLPNLNLKV